MYMSKNFKSIKIINLSKITNFSSFRKFIHPILNQIPYEIFSYYNFRSILKERDIPTTKQKDELEKIIKNE